MPSFFGATLPPAFCQKLESMESRFAKNFPKGISDEKSHTFSGGGSKALKEQFCKKNVLFFIERNTNNNCIVYEANVIVDSEGKKKLDEKEPVKVYWIMYNCDDKHEEGLNMIERNLAYGMSAEAKQDSPGRYVVKLVALKKRYIEVWCDPDGTLHAVGLVNDFWTEIIRVDIETVSGWTGPKVVKIDIIGTRSDGTQAKETIRP